MSIDPSEIVPDGVDADEIQNRVQNYSADDDDQRCPDCGYANIAPRTGCEQRFYCRECDARFDEPIYAESVQAAKRRGGSL
jgi:ribosomal protein L37AE/L43A